MVAIFFRIIILPQFTQQIVHFRFGGHVLTQAIVGILNGRKRLVLIECIIPERDTVIDGCSFGEIPVFVIIFFGIHLLRRRHQKVIGIVQISLLMDGEVGLYIHADATSIAWFLGSDHNNTGGSP